MKKKRTQDAVMALDRRLLGLLEMLETHLANDVLPAEELGGWLGDFVEKLIQQRQTDFTIAELAWAVGVAESRRSRTPPKPTPKLVIVPFPSHHSRHTSL